MKRWMGYPASLIVGCSILFTLSDLPLATRLTFIVVLTTIIIWVFGTIPPYIAALAAQIVLIAANLVPIDVVMGAAWLNPVHWLIIGSIVIGTSVMKSGASQRLAYLIFARFGNNWLSTIGAFYVLGVILAFMIPSTIMKVTLTVPLAVGLIRNRNLLPKDPISDGLILAAIAAPSLGGFITYTGSELVPITLGLVKDVVTVTWTQWLLWVGPLALIWLFVVFLVNVSLFKPKGGFLSTREEFKEKLHELGPLTGSETRALLWVSVAIVLWVTEPLHGIHPGWATMIVAVGLLLPRVGVLTEQQFARDINWPFVIYAGGVLTIGAASNYAGLSTWMAHLLIPSGGGPLALPLATLGAVVFYQVLHLPFGSAASTLLVTIPMAGQFASGLGVAFMPVVLAMSFGSLRWIFPHQNTSILVGLSLWPSSTGAMIRTGVVLSILILPFAAAAGFYWQLFF